MKKLNKKIKSIEVLQKLKENAILTPWFWFSPIALNSNSSTLPILLAILLPVSPAPAAG